MVGGYTLVKLMEKYKLTTPNVIEESFYKLLLTEVVFEMFTSKQFFIESSLLAFLLALELLLCADRIDPYS